MNQQMAPVIPFKGAVRGLVIANLAIWLIGQVIIEQLFMGGEPFLTVNFGLVPALFLKNFFLWQPVTYMFLHDATGVMHIVFNLLLLWWLGAELEVRWGKKFFLVYYFVCGVGAALLYTLALVVFTLITGKGHSLVIPVVGASGAIFGLMLAYGLIFGERMVAFMFLFPMKAKYFVLLLAGIEVVMILTAGVSGGSTANLAHLGGFVSGFLFLVGWTRWQRRQARGGQKKGGGKSKLRLVVDNEGNEKPKYWN